MRRNGNPKVIAAIAAIIGIVMLTAIWFAFKPESHTQLPETRGVYTGTYNQDDVLEINGKKYMRNPQVETILLMGIDQTNQTEAKGYRNGGQADFLRVLVIDHQKKRVTQIEIDRDTITPITILGVLGNKSGIRSTQICLSHGFGDGKEQSCELTVEAVSNLLFGTTINHYIAMNLTGVPVLNDWAGGVTVTLEDDFSSVDPTMTQGATVRLTGKQAEIFTRSRMKIGVGTNEARMRRQRQYIGKLTTMLQEKFSASQNAVGDLFDSMKEYLVTNMSRARMINEAWTAKDFTDTTVAIQGSHTLGKDGFTEFHYDEDALLAMVLNVFYSAVD